MIYLKRKFDTVRAIPWNGEIKDLTMFFGGQLHESLSYTNDILYLNGYSVPVGSFLIWEVEDVITLRKDKEQLRREFIEYLP